MDKPQDTRRLERHNRAYGSWWLPRSRPRPWALKAAPDGFKRTGPHFGRAERPNPSARREDVLASSWPDGPAAPARPRPPAGRRGELQDLLQELGGQEEQGRTGSRRRGRHRDRSWTAVGPLGKPSRPRPRRRPKEAPALADTRTWPSWCGDTVRHDIGRRGPGPGEPPGGPGAGEPAQVRVTQEVKDILKKAMTRRQGPGKRDGEGVVD